MLNKITGLYAKSKTNEEGEYFIAFYSLRNQRITTHSSSINLFTKPPDSHQHLTKQLKTQKQRNCEEIHIENK